MENKKLPKTLSFFGEKHEETTTSPGKSPLKTASPMASSFLNPFITSPGKSPLKAASPMASLLLNPFTTTPENSPLKAASSQNPLITSPENSPLKAATPIAVSSPNPFATSPGQSSLLAENSISVSSLNPFTTSQGKSSFLSASPISVSSLNPFVKKRPELQENASWFTVMPTNDKTHEETTNNFGLVGKFDNPTRGKDAAVMWFTGENKHSYRTMPPTIRGKYEESNTYQRKAPSKTLSTSDVFKKILRNRNDTLVCGDFYALEKPKTPIEHWKTPYESEFMKYLPFRIQHINKNNPNIIWIIAEHNITHLEALKKHMQKNVLSKRPCFEESIVVGMLFIGLCENKQLYRVKVIHNLVQQKQVLIHAIDYGMEFLMDYSKLYTASPFTADMKAFAFPVQIKGETYGLVKPAAKIHMRLNRKDGELINGEIDNADIDE